MAEEKSAIVPNQQGQDIPESDGLKPVECPQERYDESDLPASRKELFSYYAYYAGNNGIGSFQ